MSTARFQGFQCWNTNRIASVINTQAVSVARPIFMATHTPFTEIRYEKTPAKLQSSSEEELLAELLSRAQDDQHIFAVVQGIPGTGKSHLIRWLYERYQVENQKRGAAGMILLIERASNTLQQTLTQILDSGVFEGDRLTEQRQKLEGATRRLSMTGLEDMLINNLQVAHKERKPDSEKNPPGFIFGRVEAFLLDKVVRTELRREGGPVKRITRFLSEKEEPRKQDEQPQFLAADFEFSLEVRRTLRGPEGYGEAKALVNKLSREEYRVQLASYFNELLDFAISQTIALTGEDLERMFKDLRRELRRQGKDLVLFIEDIVAVRGLDLGLVDVLITQHTGEADREFCRLSSVIGITDSWFETRFSDHVRDRITHHLTLNLPDSRGRKESHLLAHRTAVGALAARYLNAIRVSWEDLQEWHADGADPNEIPIACHTCAYRESCHKAFGAVVLKGTANGKDSHVGLYPFNQSALETMYNGLDLAKVARTPRSFLNSVVRFVLDSHGNLVQKGLFPPAPGEMGNEFSPPTLVNSFEYRKLDEAKISTMDRSRIESLVVFWGNRTLEQGHSIDGEPTLGALSLQVYESFQVPFIGDDGPRPEVSDRGRENIKAWLGGAPLQHADHLAGMMVDYVRGAIDWPIRHVADDLVDRWLNRSTFYIEGQVGAEPSEAHMRFERSTLLGEALSATWELNQQDDITQTQQVANRTTLQRWLEANQERIVDFVLSHEPSEDGPTYEPDPIIENIKEWRSGGSLHYYEELASLLATFLREAIDWNSTGINYSLVEERVRQARLAIEGQTGKNPTYAKFFPRSNELAYALISLRQLNEGQGLTAAQHGAQIATLSGWLRKNEPSIVTFVRESHRDGRSPKSLTNLLTQSTAALACLAGELTEDSLTAAGLYNDVVTSAVRNRNWEEALHTATPTRTKKWQDLMRRNEIRSNAVEVRKQWLAALNCQVGTSTEVRFLDTATALDILTELQEGNWALNDVSMQTYGKIWTTAHEVQHGLAVHLKRALAAEKERAEKLSQRMQLLVGGEAIDEVFSQIRELLTGFQKVPIPYDHQRYTPRSTPPGQQLDQARRRLDKIAIEKSPTKSTPLLSSSMEEVERIDGLASYLEEVSRFFAGKCREWKTEMGDQEGTSVIEAIREVEKEYALIIELFEKAVEEVKSV